jgi:dienelactone hydrolase
MKAMFMNLAAPLCLLAGAGMATAQTPPPFDVNKMRAEIAAYNKLPDSPGSGRYPALKEIDPSLPDHVVYRPADLSKLPGKLGVIAWGNGGCSADGAGARLHLEELASHGYLAIASGSILSGPGAPESPADAAPPPAAPPGSSQARPAIPPPATKSSSLREAIDWALAENSRAGSRYFHRIDPNWIAVSGWSCGGLQALEIGADPRVRTAVIHNSGIFSPGTNPIPGMSISKSDLRKLHASVLYILGGPTDIAYANGMDDFNTIATVPVMVANLDVGHGGTFLQPNGGRAASVAVDWLDWQLKGDPEAAKRFMGKDCGLCKNPDWTLQKKGWPATY